MAIEPDAVGTAQDIIKGVAWYASDAEANDTYVIALPTAPSAYTDGLTIRFKANTANTGACTLNVNTLGAIAIKRPNGGDTITGDILANQIVEVVYRDGNFYMTSPLAGITYKVGTATYDISTANGTQNIAHGLGKIPSIVRIKGTLEGENNYAGFSETIYNGTTQVSLYCFIASTTVQETGTTFHFGEPEAGGYAEGVITFDATNIIITWTKTGSPTGTANLMFEAE